MLLTNLLFVLLGAQSPEATFASTRTIDFRPIIEQDNKSLYLFHRRVECQKSSAKKMRPISRQGLLQDFNNKQGRMRKGKSGRYRIAHRVRIQGTLQKWSLKDNKPIWKVEGEQVIAMHASEKQTQFLIANQDAFEFVESQHGKTNARCALGRPGEPSRILERTKRFTAMSRGKVMVITAQPAQTGGKQFHPYKKFEVSLEDENCVVQSVDSEKKYSILSGVPSLEKPVGYRYRTRKTKTRTLAQVGVPCDGQTRWFTYLDYPRRCANNAAVRVYTKTLP